jgi:hypothetical protein
MEDEQFVGFASIDVKDFGSMKFRISKIAPTFTAEALAIGKTLEIINERADLEAKQAIEEGRDSQLILSVADLKIQWNKKDKELHSFCQNTKRDREERYFDRYCRNYSALWFREIKMNRRVFMSINRMRAGHASLKASLKRFNIISTAECECGHGLQTEEHTFCDCKRYEEQRATIFCLRTAKNITQSQLQSSLG